MIQFSYGRLNLKIKIAEMKFPCYENEKDNFTVSQGKKLHGEHGIH